MKINEKLHFEKIKASLVPAVLAVALSLLIAAAEVASAFIPLGVSYEADGMREDGVFSAYERIIYANIIKSRTPEMRYFYISLHTNSFEDSQVSGLSADYYAGAPRSEVIGSFCDAFKKAVHDSLKKETVIRKDSWEEAFIVTKYADMPSVLIEMGYGTNPRDAADLYSEKWLSDFSLFLSELVKDFSVRL